MTPFLTEAEIERLYQDYRGGDYNRDRAVHEPEYHTIAREFLEYDSGYFRARREFYDEFHAGRFGLHGLVIDAGDGGGYFGRYAYPHADVVAIPRVGAAPGLDLRAALGAADVLMVTHTLQSTPRPLQDLARLVLGLRVDADVWLEVPVQYRGGLAQAFAEAEAKFARGVREYGPLQTIHETLAHFSVLSLRTLLGRVGLQPVEFVRSSIGVLGVLARRSNDAGGPAALDRPAAQPADVAHA